MKKERGSITVEAALFLPVFLMAFLTIYNLVYFARGTDAYAVCSGSGGKRSSTV